MCDVLTSTEQAALLFTFILQPKHTVAAITKCIEFLMINGFSFVWLVGASGDIKRASVIH